MPTTCTGPIDLSAEAGLEKNFKFLGVTLGGQVTASGDLGADVRQCAIDTTTISGAVKVGLTVFGEKEWPVLVFVVDYITPGAGDALQEALPSDLLSILGNVYIRGSLSGTFGAEAMTTSASSPWLQWHDIMFGGGPGIKAGYTWDQEELGTSLDLSLGLSGVASFASSPGRLVGNLSDLHFDNVTVTGEASMEYAIGGFGQKFPYTVQFTYSPNGVRSSAARLAPRPHIKKSVLYAIPHITAHDYARFQGAGKRQTFASSAARIPQSDIDGQNTITSVLATNVYTYTEPSLAVDPTSGNALLLSVYDDPTKPASQSKEIQFSRWNGSTWSVPALVTNDLYLNSAPQVAWTNSGTAVAVWQRINNILPISSTWDTTTANETEIATSTYDPASNTWSPVSLLTSNNVLDMSP